MVTREQILKKLQERKAEREAADKAVKQPVFTESVKAKDKKVIVKQENTRAVAKPRTLTEDISRRTKGFDDAKTHLYKTLAENMVNAQRIINEATQAGAASYGVTGAGAGVGLMKTYFDIFFGYFPNLIATEIASTQPIKTEKAMIFYYNTVAGKAKGSTAKGDALITPFAINTDKNFTSYLVNLLPVADAQMTLDTGVEFAYDSGAVPIWAPYVASSLLIEDCVIVWDTATTFHGVYTNAAGTEQTFDTGIVTAGATTIQVTMNFLTALTTGNPFVGDLEITYSYDNKYAPTEVPELNADVDSRDITAMARTVKTNYSFQAGYGFEAQFGVKLEDKLAEAAMFELKRETDLDFVFEIMQSAEAKVVWNKAGGVANGLYEMHKQSFMDAVIGASNHIYKISKRVRGNILIVGVNALTVVETLPGFTGIESGVQIGGPAVVGKLKKFKVIAVPSLGENDWAVIYKNEQDNLDAGIIFAPYIPVVATQPVTLDDFQIRRAYTMSYGKLVVNSDYFVLGSIVNDPMAMPIYMIAKDGTANAVEYGTIETDAGIGTDPFVITD